MGKVGSRVVETGVAAQAWEAKRYETKSESAQRLCLNLCQRETEMNRCRTAFLMGTVCSVMGMLLLLLAVPWAQANPPVGGIPEIPAFLPTATDVAMTEKLPIDGEWIISTIRKRIRIEGGRAYALDPWLHLFVLKVEPLMVVIQDLRRTGVGQYTGQDLPLMGQLTATLSAEGYLNVNVAGALGPVKYSLIPIRMDDQQRFDQEKPGQQTRPVPVSPPAPTVPAASPAPALPTPQPATKPAPPADTEPNSSLKDCKVLAVDRATGKIICKD